MSGLNNQVRTLDAQINNLTQSIDALSDNSYRHVVGNELANLVDQRSEDTSQVSALESQIQQEQLNQTSVTRGKPGARPGRRRQGVARRRSPSSTPSRDWSAASGLALVVLIVGCSCRTVSATRAQVAAALGAPVELSLLHRSAPRRDLRTRRRRLLLLSTPRRD